MRTNFPGKRILITGAGQGVGRDLALRLSSYGGSVFALSKTQEQLDSLISTDPTIQAVCVDLADWNETKKAVQNILPIDLVVNNASVAQLSSFVDITSEQFDFIFNVNVKAAFNVSQIVAKSMIERKSGGSIVNVLSQANNRAVKNHAVYYASKAAFAELTKIMALELDSHHIRVNAVIPEIVLTETKNLNNNQGNIQSIKIQIPFERLTSL